MPDDSAPDYGRIDVKGVNRPELRKGISKDSHYENINLPIGVVLPSL